MTISRLFSTVMDFVLPRYCPVCGCKLKPDEAPLCVNCLIMMPRIELTTQRIVEADDDEDGADMYDDACADMGDDGCVVIVRGDDEGWDNLNIKPQPRIRSFEDNELTDRFLGKARIERAAALFWYRDHSDFARLIYNIKYQGGRETAREAGILLAEELMPQGFFEGIDMIVPMPITCGRMAERGYNQSLMIAKGIRKVTGIPVTNNVLSRKSFKGSQTHLTASERAENVKGAFSLIDEASIANRHVLLVDDIITTGATASECASQLLKAPGCRVSIVSLGATAR